MLDQSFEYAYTAGGAGPVDAGPNLDRVIDNRDANESRFYFYDDLDRFWKASSLTGAAIQTYTYDANGNRIGEIAPGLAQTTSYQVGTDLVAQSTGTISRYYKHDVYGNRIWAGPSAYSGLPSYVFDQRNQLVEARDPVTQAVVGLYAYDVFGRRVRKITANGTTLFFYGSAGNLVEDRSLASTPNAVRDYAWIEDELVGVVDSGTTPTKFSWVHTDRLGTPLAVTGSPTVGNAQTVWRASYGPFGSAATNQDPDGDLQQYVLNVRFPGQIWDTEMGLNYNWHRYYDPSIGRYISGDPIGQRGGINLYAYVDGNPIMNSDPTGLTFRSNAKYLASWVLGTDAPSRSYSDRTLESQEMSQSEAAQKMRAAFLGGGCKGLSSFAYGTLEAFWDTALNPFTSNLGSTAFEVGGFAGASVVNNGDGTATYRVTNVSGAHSFFYHAVDNRISSTGPMRNITQNFSWTEQVDECQCR